MWSSAQSPQHSLLCPPKTLQEGAIILTLPERVHDSSAWEGLSSVGPRELGVGAVPSVGPRSLEQGAMSSKVLSVADLATLVECKEFIWEAT